MKILLRAIPLLLVFASQSNAADLSILNASYDPTREFYADFNEAFKRHWAQTSKENLVIRQSHGGSAKQARLVLEGLQADVVTLALAYDIDMLAEKGRLLPPDWQKRLPDNSSPYTSTIVFLVRKGNPRQIRDWDDLAKPGVAVILPNPKTSGGARWGYLAAWGYALGKFGGDESKVRDFMARLFKNVPVLDSGARGATDTFVKKETGDVLIAWENEALSSLKESSPGAFQLVVPSVSILAEPPVAWVDTVVNKRGTTGVAKAYLEYLYSPEGQEIAASHFYRPRLESIARKHAATFANLKLFTVDEVFGGWQKAQKTHFAEGGTFDQIQKSNR